MVILILGLPGSGKSTLVRALKAHYGGIALHPAKHAHRAGLTNDKRISRRQMLKISGLAESFVHAIGEALQKGVVIIDGFPRTEEQARLLQKQGWSLYVVALQFPPGQEQHWSIARQEERLRKEGVVFPREQVVEQFEIAMANDQQALELLQQLGCTFICVDATASAEEVLHRTISSIESVRKQSSIDTKSGNVSA